MLSSGTQTCGFAFGAIREGCWDDDLVAQHNMPNKYPETGKLQTGGGRERSTPYGSY